MDNNVQNQRCDSFLPFERVIRCRNHVPRNGGVGETTNSEHCLREYLAGNEKPWHLHKMGQTSKILCLKPNLTLELIQCLMIPSKASYPIDNSFALRLSEFRCRWFHVNMIFHVSAYVCETMRPWWTDGLISTAVDRKFPQRPTNPFRFMKQYTKQYKLENAMFDFETKNIESIRHGICSKELS